MRPLLLALVLSACGTPATCPVVPPARGSSCDDRGLACETAGSAHRRCSTFYTCGDALDPQDPSGLSWSVSAADGCMPTNDEACPTSFDGVPVGKACPNLGLSCDYAEGRCDCLPCNPNAINWRCREWAAGLDTRCPSDRPQLGTKCPKLNGVICRYDDACRVSLGPDLVCFGGVWTPRTGAQITCGAPICGIAD